MLDWLTKRPNYVVPNVDETTATSMPYITPPPPPEPPETIYYQIGITSKNRVTLELTCGSISMTREGIDNLISQLAVFRDQLDKDEKINDKETE